MRFVGHQQVRILVQHLRFKWQHRFVGQCAVVVQAQAGLKKATGCQHHPMLVQNIALSDALAPDVDPYIGHAPCQKFQQGAGAAVWQRHAARAHPVAQRRGIGMVGVVHGATILGAPMCMPAIWLCWRQRLFTTLWLPATKHCVAKLQL